MRATGPQSNTWFTKTLSSIKEVAGSGAKGVKQSPENMKKSSSEQTLGSGAKPTMSKPT